jgi:TonB-dependent receptor
MTTDFEDFGFNKRPGTRDNKIFGWRPNAQLTWTHPVSKTFGYVVTLGHEDVLARVHWSSPSRNYGNAANAVTAKARIDAGLPLTTPSVYNPARTQDLLHDNPKQDIKDYASIKFDWRPTTELKLSYSLNGSLYTERTGDDLRVTWATGTTVYNDETSTYGATGTGAFQYDMREAWRNGTKPVINQVISGEWKKGDWTIGAKGSYSVSKQTYKDTDDGFFSGTTMPGSTLPNMGIGTGKANPQLITMNLLDQSYSFSRRIEARNASGGLIDLNDLSNIYIGGAVSRQGQIVETIAAARLYAERSFGFRNALSLKVGFDYDEIYRNRKRYDAKIWTFVGPDGQAGTFDDNASQIQAVSTRPERDTYYDAPAVTRVSMSRLYDLYKAHPNWFVYRAGESHRFSVTDPYEINEQTYAPYFQFTGTFFNNRLSYIGGVRYERADAWGLGLKDNGGPVINGASTLEQAQARYERKGARGEGSNDGYFPSLESSYNITENLILRAGYAKTQAKNRFERSVIPTNSINHDGTNSAFPTAEGTITFRNANLTPWTANNYEAHLEYYTPQGGVIGVGAFRKNIGNNQVSKSVLLDTPQRVAEFGLDPEYLNYVATTWLNEGVGRLDGVEFETRQPLDVILPGFARGFVFTGSFNYNNLSKFNYANGNISTDFQNFYETQIKGSLIYRRGRFGASAGMIRNGEVYRQRDDAAGFEGHRYYPAYTTVDFSLDYALTKWAKLSISGRNVTNAHKTRIREVQNAPAWSQLHIENNLGVTYTVGISGTF